MSSVQSPNYLQELFAKELSETDTKHRLAFPSDHLHHLLSPNQLLPNSSTTVPIDFRVVDLDANFFTLRLKIRREGYLKPEITGDWLRFVRIKNLKPRDRVIFFKNNPGVSNNTVQFTVAVRRAVWVFGVVFGYAESIE